MKLLLAVSLVIPCVALAGSPAAPPEETAPGPRPGAVEFQGHQYLLVDDVEELSWAGARKQCESWGGTLAVVTGEAEAKFVAELCDGRYAFLGATDEVEEGVWVWVDGSEWKFTYWMNGQPNNYGEEDYLATYDGGEWVDVEASGEDFWMPTGFLCEWSR